MNVSRIAIIIPTYNAGSDFKKLLAELSLQSISPSNRLIIDSGSKDDTVRIGKDAGWNVVSIPKEKFSHGGTRQWALELLLKQESTDGPASGVPDIVIYLTQDIRIPKQDSLENLIAAFDNQEIAAAYGRQLPHDGASIYAAVDREFNYPAESRIKSLSDASSLGIKTVFLSNSFSAYRVCDLIAQGGFRDINICEDMDIAARFLLSGEKIAYVADAEVRHSHEPELVKIWARYKAMGRFQKENPWLKERFGTAKHEGLRLVRFQLNRIWREKGICTVIQMLAIDALKFTAYRIMNLF